MASSTKDVTSNQYFSEGEKTTHTKFKRKVVLEKEMGTSPDFKWKDLFISFTRNQEFDPIKRQLQ